MFKPLYLFDQIYTMYFGSTYLYLQKLRNDLENVENQPLFSLKAPKSVFNCSKSSNLC